MAMTDTNWALGLVGFPAVLVGPQRLRARRTPTRLEATEPAGGQHRLPVGRRPLQQREG